MLGIVAIFAGGRPVEIRADENHVMKINFVDTLERLLVVFRSLFKQ
jgi:hypothetical protein